MTVEQRELDAKMLSEGMTYRVHFKVFQRDSKEVAFEEVKYFAGSQPAVSAANHGLNYCGREYDFEIKNLWKAVHLKH